MTDITKFYEQATLTFEKLNITPGDVVIVNFPADMDPQQIHGVQLAFEELRRVHDCDVILLGSGMSIDAISEENMNKLGWYKGPKEEASLH